MRSSIHSFMHSSTHPLAQSLIHSLRHSVTHSLIHSFTQSLVPSLTHSLTQSTPVLQGCRPGLWPSWRGADEVRVAGQPHRWVRGRATWHCWEHEALAALWGHLGWAESVEKGVEAQGAGGARRSVRRQVGTALALALAGGDQEKAHGFHPAQGAVGTDRLWGPPGPLREPAVTPALGLAMWG